MRGVQHRVLPGVPHVMCELSRGSGQLRGLHGARNVRGVWCGFLPGRAYNVFRVLPRPVCDVQYYVVQCVHAGVLPHPKSHPVFIMLSRDAIV